MVGEPGDRDGVAEQVATALSAAGRRATVHRDTSALPDRDVAAVVWCVTGDLDDLDRVQAVTALVRGHGHLDSPPRLWLVSRNARPVLDGDPVDPGACALRGLLRVARWNNPSRR